MPAHSGTPPTGHVRLRNVVDDDLPIFFEYQREPEANRMAAFPARDWEAFMSHWAKIQADTCVTVKSILVDEELAGNILAWECEGKRLVGYWIGQEYWGKGVATKALTKFALLVEERPLYAYVAKHNVASIQVLQKCGFALSIEETQSLEAPADGMEELVFKLD